MEPEVIFRALADGTRQRTLVVLNQHELSVSELVDVLCQPQSTVSRHLKILRDAGLIHDRREGSTVLYSVSTPTNGVDGSELTGRMLKWIAEQSLTDSLRTRLETVVDRRRCMSDRFFAQVGRRWDTLREESFGSTFHLEAFLALLPAEWTVVDVGTGTGFLLPPLAVRFQRVIGVDPVDAMLDTARHRVEEWGLENVELRKGDLAQLPIRESQADLALSVLVLHHVPSAQKALGELHRIVRDGGQVLIVEQAAHENEAFRERMQDRWLGFDQAELGRLLQSAGFEQVQSQRLTAVGHAPDAPELFVLTGCRPMRN